MILILKKKIMILYPLFMTYKYFQMKKCTFCTYNTIMCYNSLLNLFITIFSQLTVN